MNVELIRIPEAQAKAKLRAYRKAIAAREHTKTGERIRAEFEQIEAGYKAAAKGLPLIELSKAIAMGGWDERGRPRFALAPAHLRRIEGQAMNSGTVTFRDSYRPWQRNRWERRFSIPSRPNVNEAWNLIAIVPIVPADVLPRPDLDLSRRLILWEADWVAAPVDPLLLLPLGGDLCAVEAAWDLTDLERAVIAGRARG